LRIVYGAVAIIALLIVVAMVSPRRPAIIPVTPRTAEAAYGVPERASLWSTQPLKSEMDDSEGIAFEVPATSEIQFWLGHQLPQLPLQSREHRTSVLILTGTRATVEDADDNHHVRFRFDSDAPRTEIWSESTDGKALFAPNPTSFARRLARAKRLRVEFTPFNSSPVLVEFNVLGFDSSMLQRLAHLGRWKV